MAAAVGSRLLSLHAITSYDGRKRVTGWKLSSCQPCQLCGAASGGGPFALTRQRSNWSVHAWQPPICATLPPSSDNEKPHRQSSTPTAKAQPYNGKEKANLGELAHRDKNHINGQSAKEKGHRGEHPQKEKAAGSRKGQRKRLAVFVSGGGSNFKAIHKWIIEEKIHGEVALVVASRGDCGGVHYAEDHDIPVVMYPKGKFAPDGVDANSLVDQLRAKRVDYVLLAGYLRLLPEELIREYPNAILNIHPALLPAFGGKGFYGHKVHEAVVKSGARFSGPTVHFVNEKFDEGPIVAQRVVPVLPHDTPDDVAARVLQQEHKVYPEVVQALCDGRITWRADGVPIIQPAEHGHDWQ